VTLSAATSVLGVVPLLQDIFWIGMAITIMLDHTLGTLLTMGVSLRYVTFNALQQTEQSVALAAAGEEVGKPV
jgi:hypothetical protein